VPIFEPLKAVRGPFRVTGFNLVFVPGTNAMYDLEDIRGYEAMTFAPFVATYPLWCVPQPVWFNRVTDLTKPFLNFLNVRYAVVWGKYPTPPGWRRCPRSAARASSRTSMSSSAPSYRGTSALV